jgi:hypothetical protein
MASGSSIKQKPQKLRTLNRTGVDSGQEELTHTTTQLYNSSNEIFPLMGRNIRVCCSHRPLQELDTSGRSVTETSTAAMGSLDDCG